MEILSDAGMVGHALTRYVRLSAHVAAQASKHGMDRATFIALALLVADGPQRSSALAEAMHSDPSTISRHVAQLVRDGLVERIADQRDGRACLLAPTELGVAHMEEAHRRRDRAMTVLIGDWEPAERHQFAELLLRFVDEYENHLPTLLSLCTGQDEAPPEGVAR